ncbi:GGDEF domain-containing protein [Vibrio sp. 99-70-13A1]|uniref:GGDEF domain-containing protein n=1 Tax=Vibrio sp. 99-70-13A1 TaxID=2607601 RepID=UPI001493AFB3|nr:GGDEF domain-containing protein [Vibrio sp. 99-70-13A1]NOH95644.1 GGDEF domain-containing protein [Vibrio sp. 99-70-13A1]
MKKLSSYVISVYLLLTMIPVVIFGGFDIAKDLYIEHEVKSKLYDRVVSQQLLDSKKALSQFDLLAAELVTTQISQLDYIVSVKLDSMLYAMTMAEVVNSQIDPKHIEVITYPITNTHDQQIGVLTVVKDNNAFVNGIITTIVPRIAILVILLVSVSLVFSRIILGALKTPFSQLQKLAFQIANGDYHTPSKTDSNYLEITAIFNSLEIMRVKLKGSISQLKISEEKHSRTYNITQVSLFVIKIETGRILRANNKFTEIFQPVPRKNKSAELKLFIDSLIHSSSTESFEYSLMINDEKRYFQVNRSEVIDGEIECSALDITDFILAKQESENLLLTDSLTRISNRYCFNQYIQNCKKTALEELTVMMLDLNGFKRINDTYGHAAGDQLLIEVAGKLSELLPTKTQRLFRLGGDEFVILLEGKFDILKTESLAKEIQEAVTTPICYLNNYFSVSTSIGVDHYQSLSGMSVERTLHNADVAMYEAKNNGAVLAYSDVLAVGLDSISSTYDEFKALS